MAMVSDSDRLSISPHCLRDVAQVPINYVNHNTAEVTRIATRVVQVEGGKVAATGGTELLNS